MPSFLDAVADRVIIYDGAFGTGIQQRNLTPDDFGGEALEGCNEMLVITRPDIIGELHASFLEVGVDVIETCTFGGLPATLGEYGVADRAHEINLAGARIAREAADSFATPDHPRFVAGSIGPGTKFPSLGQIRFASPARPVRGPGSRPDRRRGRRHHHRDLLRPALDQGGHDRCPPGHGGRRPRRSRCRCR